MFQISTSPAGRKATSALTVLAAIGASGMVAEVSSAAVVELDPSKAAYGLKSSYMGTGHSYNWLNWNVSQVTYHLPSNGPGFATWPIDFNAGAIANAKYRIDANGSGTAYGIPAGCQLNFSLVTEPWDPATADSNELGPDHGTTTGVDSVDVVDTLGNDFDADITPLLLTWQLNPSSYYGVRFAVIGGGGVQRGGVQAPGGAVTANLILTQGAVPEPASALVALAGAGLLYTRRRRR